MTTREEIEAILDGIEKKVKYFRDAVQYIDDSKRFAPKECDEIEESMLRALRIAGENFGVKT